MVKNHHLALSISDAGFREFRRQPEYKAEWCGGQVVVMDRFFPSSKRCHACGAVNNHLKLSDRSWLCACGAILDRDLNAAQNIEAEALRLAAVATSTGKTDVDGMQDPRGQSRVKCQLNSAYI